MSASDPVIHRLFMGHVLGPIGELPIYAYVIESGSSLLLVDTGMSSPPDPEIMKIYPMYARSMEAALSDHRLFTSDITHLALSHLDHDHAGNNFMFRRLPVFVRREELENARGAHSEEFRSTWDGDDVDFRVLEGDVEIVPGVTSLHTPGHTPGHQSFVISRQGTHDLVVGDAAYNFEIYQNAETYTPDHPVWAIQVRTDRETWMGTIHRLRSLDVDRLYFSHDDVVATQPRR